MLTKLNPNSPKQILDYLRSEGVSLTGTSEDVLTENEHKHPLISKILQLRTLTKLKGTYIDGYRKHVDSNNLIHSEFSVEGTETGRCFSRNPNLQNTPVSARGIFTSRFPGGQLIQSDLSQLEYRLIAFETKDARLLDIFKNGKDIHKIAATFITGKPEDQITKEERKLYKTVNYASIYGVGKERFYASIGREDEKLFYAAKNLYPGVNKFKQRLEAQLNHTGLITNMFGRSRRFTGPISYSDLLESFNWLFQGVGHAILKLIVIELCDKLKNSGCLLVNECHDSFIIDTPADKVEFVKQKISNININRLIEGCFSVKLDVPMYLETEISEMWK